MRLIYVYEINELVAEAQTNAIAEALVHEKLFDIWLEKYGLKWHRRIDAKYCLQPEDIFDPQNYGDKEDSEVISKAKEWLGKQPSEVIEGLKKVVNELDLEFFEDGSIYA